MLDVRNDGVHDFAWGGTTAQILCVNLVKAQSLGHGLVDDWRLLVHLQIPEKDENIWLKIDDDCVGEGLLKDVLDM